MANIFLTLHVYRGKITYNEKGECTSENHPMKLETNTIQFDKWLSGAANTGITKIVVKGATLGGKEPVELSTIADLIAKVEGCVQAPEKKLSPVEQELKELREMVAALKGGKPEAEKKESPKAESESELEEVRQLYFETLKKKPHHKMSVASMREEIANA